MLMYACIRALCPTYHSLRAAVSSRKYKILNAHTRKVMYISCPRMSFILRNGYALSLLFGVFPFDTEFELAVHVTVTEGVRDKPMKGSRP